MRNRIRTMLLIGGVVLVAGLTAAPSSATTMTWKIHPGGAISGKSAAVKLGDGSSTLLTCASRFKGKLKSGSGLPGKGAGSITSMSFSNCKSAVAGAATLTPALPWPINFSTLSKGVVDGTWGSVKLSFGATGCSATVQGTSAANGVVLFTWTLSTGKLTLLKTGGNLHYTNVTGCFGLISNGDPASLSGTYTVTPTQSIS